MSVYPRRGPVLRLTTARKGGATAATEVTPGTSLRLTTARKGGATRIWPLLLSLPLAMVGCMVGPDYHKPATGETQAAWAGTRTPPVTTQPSLATDRPADLRRWWTNFHDKELDSLVERAIGANLDIKQAASRLRQARAQRGVVSAALWPQVTGTGSYELENLGYSHSFLNPTERLFEAGLDATWELDLFGGTRRNIESAQASIQAAVEDQRDVLVSTIAEVALDYANLRGYQRQIVIARENLKVEEHSAVVTREKLRGGLVGKLDVANADALAATTRAAIPVLRVQVQQTIYALAILLDRPPAALVSELATDAPIPATPPVIPIGLPADLLRRRPDVRQAEAQVHAANAQIGVAVAQFFPQFSLTGSVGGEAGSFRKFLTSGNPLWDIGPDVTWPIFTAGATASQVNVQKELTQQALLTYRQTVLTALSDVESALAAYAREQEHRDALQDAVVANRQAVDISNLLYRNGQTDFLNVLTAETSLFTSENALVLSNLSLTTDLVALYKALGGGWEDVPLRVGPTTRPAADRGPGLTMAVPATQPAARSATQAMAP